MKKIGFCIAFIVAAVASFSQSKEGIAITPPMGWNSYNCFGSAVHEDEVKANADYMNLHFKKIRLAICGSRFFMGL